MLFRSFSSDTDENCNGLADDADFGTLPGSKFNFFADSDNDTFTVATASRYCDAPAGFRAAASALVDCNDNNAAINPSATEVCDAGNVDENCNNLADNNDIGALDSTKANFWADADSDTYTVAGASRFCDLPTGFRAAVGPGRLQRRRCGDQSGRYRGLRREQCRRELQRLRRQQ